MRTDKQVHQLFVATPELLFTLAELPCAGPCSYESVTFKEVERRLDGVARLSDSAQSEIVVEIQFYPDEWIYDRVLAETHLRRLTLKKLNVRALVFFAEQDLDPADHPDRGQVTVVYLDEALRKLAETHPNHPAVAAFAPLWTTDRGVVASNFKRWYHAIRDSRVLDQAQRTRYEEVFFSWSMQRLGLKDLKDLDMLITDLPELEDTDFYRLMMDKGVFDTILLQGRHLWGAEPRDIPERLRELSGSELRDLAKQIHDLPNWDSLRTKLPLGSPL